MIFFSLHDAIAIHRILLYLQKVTEYINIDLTLLILLYLPLALARLNAVNDQLTKRLLQEGMSLLARK